MALLSAEQIQAAETYLVSLSERMEAVRDPTALEGEGEKKDSEEVDYVQVLGDNEGSSLFSKLLEKKNRERLAATSGRTAARGTASDSKRAALRSLMDEHDRTSS